MLQVSLLLLSFFFPASIACKKLLLHMAVEGRRHVADGWLSTPKLYLADQGNLEPSKRKCEPLL